MMHGREKSDLAIGAAKPANNDGRPSAELVERRAGAEGNVLQQSTRRAQDRVSVSQALARVRQAVRPLRRQTPKVGAECPNWARSDLCGGRSVMSVPTAIKPHELQVCTTMSGQPDSRPARLQRRSKRRRKPTAGDTQHRPEKWRQSGSSSGVLKAQ